VINLVIPVIRLATYLGIVPKNLLGVVVEAVVTSVANGVTLPEIALMQESEILATIAASLGILHVNVLIPLKAEVVVVVIVAVYATIANRLAILPENALKLLKRVVGAAVVVNPSLNATNVKDMVTLLVSAHRVEATVTSVIDVVKMATLLVNATKLTLVNAVAGVAVGVAVHVTNVVKLVIWLEIVGVANHSKGTNHLKLELFCCHNLVPFLDQEFKGF